MIDLHQFDGCPSHLDKGDPDSWTGAVGLDEDLLPLQRLIEIIHLEGHVWDGFHQFGIRGTGSGISPSTFAVVGMPM